MVSAHEFLDWVLPNEGFKCATVLDERPWQRFFADTDELADFILAQDALGKTVYHACASFLTSDSRKASNASKVCALWADVDSRTTHANAKYLDAPEAAAAVSDFCHSVGLPTPIYIGSGGGIYAVWPLEEDLEPDAWRRYAKGIKLLFSQNHLEVDWTRTGDIASILRTPGTHNRKGGGNRLVECGPLVGPYALKNFPESHVSGTSRIREYKGSRLIDACLSLYGEPDADPDLIVERCNQIAAVKRDPGGHSEPIIYATLGVIRHCREGATHALEWFDPKWHDQVAKKLKQQAAFGPTTCAHFESINPQGCEGCPHKGKITSPIRLGRDNASASQNQIILKKEETEQLPLPQGFEINELGLCHAKEDKKGNLEYEKISRFPIRLESVQTSEVDGHAFSLVFSLTLPRTRRTIAIPAKVFFSASGISEITGQGAIIHQTDLFKDYVRLTVDEWHSNRDVETRYDQFGWKNDDTSFLWGRRLYGSSSIKTVVGSSELEYRAQYLDPTKGGSLAKWSAAANNLFADGLESQSFGLLCAFAAPLMRFHTRLEGGAIVSFVSDQSGSGKSTTLDAAASVWGRRKGTQLTDTDTKVAQGLKLGVMGNLPATYDEMASKDPEVIRQFVLMFTGGQDKDRGKSDGTLIHTKAEWQTLLLLASNKPLVDLLSDSDSNDAPAFRLLEFNSSLPLGTDPRKGEIIKRELDANSGHAGDAYLRILMQPEVLSYARTTLPQWTDEIWARTKLQNQHRFWVRTIAAVVVAGTIVQKHHLLDFSMPRITDWICDYVSKATHFATVTGVRSEGDILADFISLNMENMLVMPHAWKPKALNPPRVLPKKHLLLRYEQEEGNLYIVENVLRKYLLSRGVHRRTFESRLQDQGLIKGVHRYITMGAGTEYASGQSVAYLLDTKHPAMSGIVREVHEKLVDAQEWDKTTPIRKKT